jgi:GMP synthase-like glutamine amidotransferase
MALTHREKPIYGVQFHPESIATHYGHQLLSNFITIARGQSPQPLKGFEREYLSNAIA